MRAEMNMNTIIQIENMHYKRLFTVGSVCFAIFARKGTYTIHKLYGKLVSDHSVLPTDKSLYNR